MHKALHNVKERISHPGHRSSSPDPHTTSSSQQEEPAEQPPAPNPATAPAMASTTAPPPHQARAQAPIAGPFKPPKSYRAYAFTEKEGSLQPIDVPWKDPGPGEIVVKVLACGVCASDEVVKHQLNPKVIYPRIPGHEIVGDVVAVPPSEKLWKVGQRVGGGWHGGHCTTCERCRAGDFVTCQNQAVNGVTIDGGYAEFVTLRSEAVASVPADLDAAEAAPLLCAGITTFNSIRHMGLEPGDLVAVQGIGGLGHLAIQYCRAMGFRTVALSSSAAKEKLAHELGATDYIDGSKVDQAAALREMGGAKLIACTAPNPAVIQKLLPALAVGGQLLILALAQDATIPLRALITKRLSIRGWPSGTAADSEEAIRFAQAQGVKCMVQPFSLAEANKAYDHRSTARFRGVIIPSLGV